MPAVAAAPLASLNAGSVTSQIPIPIPAGSDVSTSVRTPGEPSAPSAPARGRPGCGRIARDGGSAVKATVPAMTLAAESTSAAGGVSTVATSAVTSGPAMKINSISTESSA